VYTKNCFPAELSSTMKYPQALEDYLIYLRINRGASPKTVEQYELHIWKFFEFVDPKTTSLATQDLTHIEIYLGSSLDPAQRSLKMQAKMLLRSMTHLEIEHITLSDLNEFRLSLVDRGLSVNSANAYMITFRAFFKYLKKQ
jgi:site-specific recombinase XerD